MLYTANGSCSADFKYADDSEGAGTHIEDADATLLYTNLTREVLPELRESVIYKICTVTLVNCQEYHSYNLFAKDIAYFLDNKCVENGNYMRELRSAIPDGFILVDFSVRCSVL